jgi:hypothetical protein
MGFGVNHAHVTVAAHVPHIIGEGRGQQHLGPRQRLGRAAVGLVERLD